MDPKVKRTIVLDNRTHRAETFGNSKRAIVRFKKELVIVMSAHKRPPVPAIIAVIIGVQALLMLWFAWPAQNAEPRDLPIVVAGPQQAADAFATQLRTTRPGAFEVTTVADAAAADGMLRDREAYGAFVLGPDGVQVHVATAASPAVATALGQLGTALGQAGGRPVAVVEIVPAGSDDPRGAGFANAFLPLILTSIVAGAVIALLAGRLAMLTGYALGAGLLAAALMQWTGVLGGSYLAGPAAIALFTGAIAAIVAGLAAVAGRAGIALGAVLVFVVGNPLSGLAAAPELLPQPWGQLGQFLPPGAGATLLRSAGFFDWAGAGQSVLVLSSYALVGLVLVLAGTLRRRPAPTDPVGGPAPVAPAPAARAAA
jgi:hypothetical protein